jgi:hypothetical protein
MNPKEPPPLCANCGVKFPLAFRQAQFEIQLEAGLTGRLPDNFRAEMFPAGWDFFWDEGGPQVNRWPRFLCVKCKIEFPKVMGFLAEPIFNPVVTEA